MPAGYEVMCPWYLLDGSSDNVPLGQYDATVYEIFQQHICTAIEE